MKVVIQRCEKACVSVNNNIIGNIDNGLLLLVGFTHNDNYEHLKYFTEKIINMRIFDDENGVMNKSIIDVKGSILSVSQFTLYGDATKGRRPSYVNALEPKEAKKLYDEFNKMLESYVPTQTGEFGADMKVNLVNNGPVTIILEK